jgi:hypothetical protein
MIPGLRTMRTIIGCDYPNDGGGAWNVKSPGGDRPGLDLQGVRSRNSETDYMR